MKSKNPKIQTILKKGIVVLISAMLTLTPIVQATSSLDDNYLDSSWLDKLLYGSVGSTAKEIEEFFKTHTTLYITNETQLRALAEYVNNGNDCNGKEIVLLNDIEIDSSIEWIPIGTKYSNSFYGTFDGNGFSISGLKYLKEGKTQEELIHVGLFGISYGNIKNVTINNFNIDLLWDEEDLKFDEDYNKGMVTTIQVATGNLVASNYGTIENCINNSNIRGGRIVGGLVASNSGSVINCKNTGDIAGFYEVGGIVGEIPRLKDGATHSLGKVENCINEGNVHAAYIEAGGIVASISSNGEVKNCKNTGDVFTSKDAPSKHVVKVLGTNTEMLHARVGGIVGYLEDSNVQNCINEGEIYGYNAIGGIVGYSKVNKSQWDDVSYNKNIGNISGNDYIGGIIGKSANTTIGTSINSGEIIGHDIVGGIAGEFISSRVLYTSNINKVKGNNKIGGIVGYADNSDVNNVSNTISFRSDNSNCILGNKNVGGIIGQAENNTTVKYNINRSPIRGCEAVGGIVGYGKSLAVENSYNADAISDVFAGPINVRDIYGKMHVGGIIGKAESSNVKECVNVGELCGYVGYVGGITGYNYNTNINDCVAFQGVYTDYKNYTVEGGTFKYNNSENIVESEYSSSSINAPVGAGLIVGHINNKYSEDSVVTISGCLVATGVYGSEKIGGIIGNVAGNKGTVNCNNISRSEYLHNINSYIYNKETKELDINQYNVNEQLYGSIEDGTKGSRITAYKNPIVPFEELEYAGVQLGIVTEDTTVYHVVGTGISPNYPNAIVNINKADVSIGFGESDAVVGYVEPNSAITAKDSRGTEATFTISGGTVKNGVRYFKAGQTVTVKANFNKYLATAIKPINETTKLSRETAPVLKLNNSVEMTRKKIEAINFKTVITYEYKVAEGQEVEVKTVNLSELTPVYAGDINTAGTELLNAVELQCPMKADVSNVKIDAVEPGLNTNIYVENSLETERYTIGKDIIIEVTTNERIDGDYNRPEIKVEFSKSGEGKYNYSQEENTVGFAKCIDAKLNIDGTTTWKYIYQIQEGDEGEFEFNFASGTIKDIAGNTSNIVTQYTPQNSSFGSQNSNWNSNVGVSYKLYKNSVSNSNEIKDETYFAKGEDLVVVTTFDKLLYSYYTKINDTEHKKAIDKNTAPSLYLPNGTKVNASSVSNSQNTVITYKFEDISNNYQTLTNLKALKLVNENNKVEINLSGNNVTTEPTTEAQPIIFNFNNTNENIAKDAIKIINIENVVIDNQGVREQLKSNIYADTTAPTISITAEDTTNPTNANLITYTIEASENVVGFEESDITVINGVIKGDIEVVEEGKKYTVEVETVPVSIGNQEEVKLILEEGICKDLVGRDNVRVEHVTIIDKKAPEVTITSDKEYVKANEDITYTFTWSEEVVEFTEENITVNNGKKGTFAGEGNKYTLVVKANGQNDVEVFVGKDVTKDIAGNNNIASAKNIIPVIPTVEITTNTSNPTNESEITYTFEWNEKVVGFDSSDILLPNGVTGTLEVDEEKDNTYKMVVNYNSLIPDGNEGEVTVAVKEKAVTDSNGNENAYTANTLKIDRIAPIFIGLESYAVSDISLDPDVDTVKQYYKEGDIVKIVATFTENIEKSDVPTLNLQFSESGNAKGNVTLESKTANKITYTYTITAEDTGVLSVKGFSGIVKDIAGNETIVTKRALDGDTIIADTTTLKLVGLTAIAPDFEYEGLLNDGETKRYGVESKTRDNNTITIIAEYSENVYNLNSETNAINNIKELATAPTLSLNFGNVAAKGTVEFSKVEGNKVYYTYDITDDITDGDNGDLSIASLIGEVSDIAGNRLTINTSSPNFDKYEEEIKEENEVTKITADTKPSSIKYDSVTAVNYDDKGNVITGNSNYYRKGAVITVVASTDEYVYKNTNKTLVRFTEEDAPTLDISFATIGTGVGTCTDVKYENNKTVFTYTYTVKENDNGQLRLSIAENIGYDIALNRNKALSESKSIYADTVNPVTNWQSWVESEGYGIKDLGNGTWEVTFSEKLYVYDNANYKVGSELSNSNKNKAPILLVSKDNVTALETTISNIAIRDNKTVITYTYSPYTENIGTYGMKFASVSDKAGNLFNYKDQIPPILTSIEVVSPVTGTYKAGEVITIVATFNEKLKEDSTAPVLALQFTTSGDAKGVVSTGVISDKTITYTYTITAHDNIGNGDNGVLQVKSYTGTGLTDAYDNIWVEETKSLEGYTITADTITPVITRVRALVDGSSIGSYNKDPQEYVPGRTNADTIVYEVIFSEDIDIINEDIIKVINGEKIAVGYTEGSKNKIRVTVRTTEEGAQTLIIPAETVEDIAGNRNEYFRFNAITTDFTKPTVRFISEYNGGVYVLPTNIGKVEIRPNVEINEDIDSIEYNWDGENDGTFVKIDKYSSTSDIVVPTKVFTGKGEHILYIKVTDIAGNVTIASKEYSIEDSGIKITAANEGIADDAEDKLLPVNGNVIVTVNFEEGLTDNRKVTFRAEGSNESIVQNAAGTNEKGTQYIISTNGVIYAEATDRVGNKVFTEYSIENIDTEYPEIAIELNGANLVIGTGKDTAVIKTNVETSDNKSVAEAKYAYLQEDIDLKNITSEQIAEISNTLSNEAIIESATSGIYYLYVLAKDPAGNVTIAKSNPFTVVDTNIRGEAEKAEKPVDDIIIFEEVEEDVQDRSYVNVRYDDTIVQNANISLTKPTYGFKDGNYIELYGETKIEVYAYDACGNEVYNEYEAEDIITPTLAIFDYPEDWTKDDVTIEIRSNSELKNVTIKEKNDNDYESIALNKDKCSATKEISQYGEYTVKVTDIYDNPATEQTIVIKVDKSAPNIEDVDVENGVIKITANDIDKDLGIELSGIAGYAITKTNEVPVEWTKSNENEIEVTEDGTFYVWVKDNVGHVTMREEVVTRDITAPEVTVTATPELGKWVNTNINIAIEANEELSSLKIKEVTEEGDGIDILTAKAYEITSSGTYTITAKDMSGNETVETIEAKIDKDLPDVPNAIPTGRKITITAEDVGSGIAEYAITKTTEEPVEWSKSNAIKVTEDGIFYVWVKDNAGNIKVDDEVVVVDTTAPAITFSYLSQTVTVGMPLEANISTNENAIISYSWDNENWVDSETLISRLTISEKSTTPGEYTLYVKATDDAGNESEVQVLEFTVSNIEEIKQPDIIFEDIPTIQVNGVKYVKVSPNTSIEYLTNRMNREALCGKNPEYIKLTKDGKLRTGSEIAINGSTKYIVVVNGDVNSDGGIDFIKDIIRANNYRLGLIDLSIPQILAADVNNDGKIEFIQDIIAINNFRLGLIKSL